MMYLIGYAIGVTITCSLWVGLQLLNLYDKEIKVFFHRIFGKRHKGNLE